VLRAALELLESRLDEEHPERMELESIVTALEHLPSRNRPTPRASPSVGAKRPSRSGGWRR
jgi:hypothetical protein